MKVIFNNSNLAFKNKAWEEYVLDTDNTKFYSLYSDGSFNTSENGGRRSFCISLDGISQIRIDGYGDNKFYRAAFTDKEPVTDGSTVSGYGTLEMAQYSDANDGLIHTLDVPSWANYIVINAMNSGTYNESNWRIPNKVELR